MTISEKIKALVTSKATDEDRLQVLIHLTAELAEKLEQALSDEDELKWHNIECFERADAEKP